MPYLTRLHTVDHDDGWELTQPLIYSSRRYGQTIITPIGFVSDYASVPRIPIVFALTGDTGHKAAVTHDDLYRSKHARFTRHQADMIFREALMETEPPWRAWVMWAGVRAWGWMAWQN
jgi:hypothetical protein